MNTVEARSLLDREMQIFRAEPYARLSDRLAGGELTYEVAGDTGTTYQVEVLIQWDSEPGGAICVIGSIDDGGWRAFVPLTTSFIKAPDGSFVGEQA
jgi:hypothetical protein